MVVAKGVLNKAIMKEAVIVESDSFFDFVGRDFFGVF